MLLLLWWWRWAQESELALPLSSYSTTFTLSPVIIFCPIPALARHSPYAYIHISQGHPFSDFLFFSLPPPALRLCSQTELTAPPHPRNGCIGNTEISTNTYPPTNTDHHHPPKHSSNGIALCLSQPPDISSLRPLQPSPVSRRSRRRRCRDAQRAHRRDFKCHGCRRRVWTTTTQR